MAKQAKKASMIIQYLQAEFSRIYKEKNSNSVLRKQALPEFKFKEDIVRYVFDKKLFIDSDKCEDGEESLREQVSDNIIVSKNTVRKAINRMIQENQLEMIDGEYCWNPQIQLNRRYAPLFSVSNQLNITFNVPETMLLLEVSNGFSAQISDYLSAVFYQKDILFIPMGTYVLCVGVLPQNIIDNGIPENEKTPTPDEFLRYRIKTALSIFNCCYPDFTYRGSYEISYAVQYNQELRRIIRDVAKVLANSESGYLTSYTENDYFTSLMNGFALVAEKASRMWNTEVRPLSEERKKELDDLFDDSFDDPEDYIGFI